MPPSASDNHSFIQGSLFEPSGHWAHEHTLESQAGWPDADRFPLNRPGQTVESVVLDDLRRSAAPLIVTGYASLDRIIAFAADLQSATVRLLLGNEPFESRTRSFVHGGRRFSAEVRDYWLARGISLFHSAKLIATIERIEGGALTARYIDSDRRPLHAKIYCGADAVSLGSSNFTQAGMTSQLECNARFSREKEPRRYREAVTIAENFWAAGVDYTAELLELLRQLLRVVTWQEALARACAELLEGEWAEGYLENQVALGDTTLWPSQKAGIAQALWVLENVGSVLVADPTGSGKTRLGAHLLRALVDRTWSSGRGRHDLPLLVSPPAVRPNWEREATYCGLPLATRSHGVLSRADSDSHTETQHAIQRAQILAIDEAHNFLNLGSQRSKGILSNMADHVVLFTATPINRGATDLLSLVDMLGADNMEDETIRRLELLARRKGSIDRSLSPSDVDALRKEINRFTLRRTKVMLNELVDREPGSYLDPKGRVCRYPKHDSRTYSTGESQQDCQLAEQIRDLAKQLRGLALLESHLEMPDALRRDGWDEEAYLRGRLSAVQSLSRYNILSRLRSSRAALHEHLEGTGKAVARYALGDIDKTAKTGAIIDKLRGMNTRGGPTTSLKCVLPDWLTVPQEWVGACEFEVRIYTQILALLERISSSRERAKAEHLKKLIKRHNLILAFDSHLITLEVIRKALHDIGQTDGVVVATGSSQAGRRQVVREYGRDSKASGIALCSDALSEGLNLQGSSTVVHLDMPSVVRIAEQRVGRVDRMDSPHQVIEAWWPDDSPSFAVHADERFVQRYQTVKTLLGANMPLPPQLSTSLSAYEEVVRPETIIQETEEAIAHPWDGIEDAFSPVRNLVTGASALVPAPIYREYAEVKARVLSRVGLVLASKPWAFFAIRGHDQTAPRWILFDSAEGESMIRLEQICDALRGNLNEAVEDLPMSAAAGAQLDRFLSRLQEAEIRLLPRKKQRALDQMRQVLLHHQANAERQGHMERAARIDYLASLATVSAQVLRPDIEVVAEQWLDWIRPRWFDKLAHRRKRRRPLLLRDLQSDLFRQELGLDALERKFLHIPTAAPLDQRIAACIVGVSI